MNNWRENYDAETLKKFDDLIAEYSQVKGSLITILQGTQELFGYLSRDAMSEMANT